MDIEVTTTAPDPVRTVEVAAGPLADGDARGHGRGRELP
jgi:hypothetical protein